MLTVRQKILEYIIEKRAVTTAELSKVFRVTPANIRHHLSILRQQGCIKSIKTTTANQKGRPAQVYSPTLLEDQNNLDRLTSVLLKLHLNSTREPNTDYQITKLAESIGSEFTIDSSNPTRILYATIQSLNRMHYQAHWEAHFDKPRIMFSHCPYRMILDTHPELCKMDTALLEFFLSVPVVQVEKLAMNLNGIPECVFLMTNRA